MKGSLEVALNARCDVADGATADATSILPTTRERDAAWLAGFVGDRGAPASAAASPECRVARAAARPRQLYAMPARLAVTRS